MEYQLMKSNNSIALNSLQEVQDLAVVFQRSGLFGAKLSVEQATVKVMAGQEIGVGPFTAMNNIDIIQGKTVMNAKLMGAKIKNSGKYNYKILELTNEICKIEFFENDEPQGIAIFSKEEANKIQSTNQNGYISKLTDKDNWKNYPSDMLFARTLSRGARRYCPEVIMGIYVEGEIEEPETKPNNSENEEIHIKSNLDLIKNSMNQNNTANVELQKVEIKEIPVVEEVKKEESELKSYSKSDRPYSPEILKQKFIDNSLKLVNFDYPPNDDTLKYLNIALQTLIGNRRIDFIKFIAGKESTKDISQAQAMTLLKWLGYNSNQYDPKWEPTQILKREVQLVLEEVDLKNKKDDFATALFGGEKNA